MPRLSGLFLAGGSLAGRGGPGPATAAPAPDDPYLAGYAGAVLEREFRVNRRAVTVENGVLTLDAAQLAGADRARILTVLAALPRESRAWVPGPSAPGPPARDPVAAHVLSPP